MTMITPSYLGETIEYSSLHACRSTLEDPTADTALRFARYFKNSATFWMNLQTRYDLEVAEDKIAAKVRRDVQPLEAVPAPEA